jgi:hypothetical protein
MVISVAPKTSHWRVVISPGVTFSGFALNDSMLGNCQAEPVADPPSSSELVSIMISPVSGFMITVPQERNGTQIAAININMRTLPLIDSILECIINLPIKNGGYVNV